LPVFSVKKFGQTKKTERRGSKKAIGAYPTVQPINRRAIVLRAPELQKCNGRKAENALGRDEEGNRIPRLRERLLQQA
jgi:hypothetical protein